MTCARSDMRHGNTYLYILQKLDSSTGLLLHQEQFLNLNATWSYDRTQEFLPEDLGYCVYRSDRKKGSDLHGGVLICVTKWLISDPVPELETDCEILWVKINLVSVNSLLVGAFHRPHMHDDKAIVQLNLSLQGLNRSNATVWLAGDFNAPHIDYHYHYHQFIYIALVKNWQSHILST